MKRIKKEKGPKLNFDNEVDFHGLTGDEAVLKLEEALYTYEGESLLVVHGRGSGVLRMRIRDFLASSKLPKSVEYGENINLPGADGVTVVHL